VSALGRFAFYGYHKSNQTESGELADEPALLPVLVFGAFLWT
jgi:hypothetical protein